VRPGEAELRAVAEDDKGRRYEFGVAVLDYPHIRARQLVKPAVARVRTTALALPRLARVGYIRGASDRVPEALQSVGVPLELLDRSTLERGELSRFDAIIVGSRAYEIDTALVENNDRLLAYARAGGLVIVQYQQYPFVNGHFAPYTLSIAQPHDRVTEEDAPVSVVNVRSPVLLRPNRIGSADWEGWEQERGLYFAHTWDAAYRPVIEMHDQGGPPLQGGLLVARLGRGTYVYTGLSFFRELPAGVPGAFRLFANLLGLARNSGGPRAKSGTP
jgi:hypothetical protein